MLRALLPLALLPTAALAQKPLLLEELHRSLPVEHDFTITLAVADFDGDGFEDVFGGNRDQPDNLLLGDGQGSFRDHSLFLPPESFQCRDAVAGDVDRDGDLDLFLGATFTNNRLYLNNGAALFVDASGQLPAETNTTVSVGLGDVDGDGDLDAVHFNSSSEEDDELWLNDGSAVYSNAPFVQAFFVASDFRFVDVDGDTDLDVLATDRLYLNDGSGSYTNASSQYAPGTGSPAGITVADFDGDGDDDFAVARNGAPNSVYLGDGAGNFTEKVGALPVDAAETFSLDAGDVDGDGDADLYLANSHDGQNQLLLNDGAATFADVTATHLPARLSDSDQPWLFDADGDGDQDVYVANSGNEQDRLYRNDGAGVFQDTTKHPSHDDLESAGPTADIALGDVNGDGDDDLVEVNLTGPPLVRVLTGDGTGAYTEAPGPLPFSTVAGGEVALEDVDGDGDLDLIHFGITILPFGSTAAFWRNGPGGFVDDSASVPQNPEGHTSIALGDLDADGDPDAFVGRSGVLSFGGTTHGNLLLRNEGGVFFSDASGQIPGDTEPTLDVELADVDGDGDLDAVLANGDACAGLFCEFQLPVANRLYLNDGFGTFTDGSAALPPHVDSSTAVLLEDLSGDGLVDIVFANTNGQLNRLYHNGGGGTFVDQTPLLAGSSSHTLDVTAGDVDEDGSLDLLFVNLGVPFPGGLALALGGGPIYVNGNSLLAAPDGDEGRAAEFSDVDGDGDLDLLVGNLDENRLYSNLRRHLAARSVPGVAKSQSVDLYGDPTAPWGLFASAGTSLTPLPPFGTLFLDPLGLIFLDAGFLGADGIDSRTFPIGSQPGLVGQTAHLQAVMNLPLRLTNREAATFTGL